MSAARGRHALSLLVLALALVGAGTFVGSASAGTLHVTNCANSGAGSLRDLINASSSGDTIVFDLDCTITLFSQISIGTDLTIDGSGHSITITAINARIFLVTSTATMNRLTLANGSPCCFDVGGAIANVGTLTVTNSTFRQNSAGQGGGIWNGGTLTVRGSTFDANTADYGGGIKNQGTLTIDNSTFASNDGGGASGALDNQNTGTITVRNSTFVNNTSPLGGLIYNQGPASFTNTIVTGTSQCDGTVGVFNGGNTLQFGDTSCGFSITANPVLGSLASNGGPTSTFALLEGSPAIGAGSAAVCQAAGIDDLDQRGAPRRAALRGRCDIGAYDTRGYIAGPISASATTILRSAAKVTADNSATATITVRAKDAYGTKWTTGGATVVLDTTLGDLGTVVDNGDGTYTSTLTSPTTVGHASITGTINGATIGNPTGVDFVAGPPDGSTTTMGRSVGRITANGTATSTIIVRAKDGFGNTIQVGGATVVLNTTLGTLSSVTDNNNGTYTATLKSTTAGKGTVSGTINGNPITATVSVDFVPGAPSGATTAMSRSVSRITADGSASSTITVRAKDANGNVIQVGGATVVLNTTLGTLSSVTDNNNGTYTATLKSTVAGTGTVSGTINGNAITATTAVDFVPGPPAGSTTTMSRSASSIPANGTSTATVTVIAKDQYGNEIKVGGATVILNTSRGSLGSVTDLGNGRYRATLTSSATPGIAHITGTINGQTIGHPTSISFT